MPTTPARAKANPFLLKPVAWLSHVDLIHHSVLFNPVMMVILADDQGGKTSFVDMLTHVLEPQIIPCVTQAHASLSVNDLAQVLAHQLEKWPETHATLHDVVLKINAARKHVLFVIDDAHRLDEACVRALFEAVKQQQDDAFFHVLLMANHSMTARLDAYRLMGYTNVLRTLSLGALSRDETQTYVSMRSLQDNAAPLQDASIFFAATQGVVAHINAQLNHQKITSQPLKPPLRKAPFAWVASIAVLGLSLGFGWQQWNKPHVLITPPVAKLNPDIHPISDITPIDFKHRARATYYPSQVAPFFLGATRQTLQPPPLTKVYAHLFDVEDEYIPNLGVVDKVVVVPKTLTEAQKASLVVPPSEIASIDFPMVHRLKHAFTIQLMASQRQSDVRAFLKKHPDIQSTASVRQFTRNGAHWYVLLLGIYPEEREAKQALNQLPKALGSLKPWVRPLAGLKTV